MTQTMEHTYSPRGACASLLFRRDAEVVVSGPAGTGKSRACLEKMHAMCLLNPGMRALMVRKTAISLKTTALVTYRRDVANECILAGSVVWRTADSEFVYSNGSVIVASGMDKASRIMSSEYDLIYVQEATELVEDDWEHLTTRLRNGKVSFQQLIADCNPAMPTHWLHVRADAGRTLMLESRHEDNPLLFDERRDQNGPKYEMTERGASYLTKLDALTGVRHSRLRKGLWVSAEGMIYEDFDPAIHLLSGITSAGGDNTLAGTPTSPVDRAGVPLSWTRYWSVDFGFSNPFVCQNWAEDHDGRLYLYREFYFTKRTVDQHAEQILSVVAPEGRWTEPRPSAIVCDHDAEGRAQLEKVFGATTAAHKAVTEGIQAVQGRLKVSGDGKPRLYILRDCLVRRDPELAEAKKPTCTAEEIPGYVWQPEGTGATGQERHEHPVKEDDHGCDAMRYIVAHRDLQPHGNPFRGFIGGTGGWR